MRVVLALVLASSLSSPSMGDGAGRVVRIAFEGAERTREHIMLRAIELRPGDLADSAALGEARQRLLDLELFESVEVSARPVAEGVDVVFQVEEKRFWIVLPRISRNTEGDTTFGIDSRFNNLFGLNHTLEARLGRKDHKSFDRDTEDRAILDYHIPGVRDSRYDLRLRMMLRRLERTELDAAGLEVGEFEEENRSFSVGLARWIEADRPIGQGWRLGVGLHHRTRENQRVSGALLRPAALAQVGVSFLAEKRSMHHHVYSDSGEHFGYRLELGMPDLSDHGYAVQEIFYWRIWRFGEDDHRNLYLRLGAGRFRDGDPSFVSFGYGRPDLRNVLDEVDDGDSYEFVKFGYLHPIFGKDSLRAEVFMDAGRETLSIRTDPPASNLAVGLGVRWRIRKLVRFELAIAVARSIDTGETKLVIGTEGLD